MTRKKLIRYLQAYAENSYLYYCLDKPIIPDAEFDRICLMLYGYYEIVKVYDVNNYLNKDDLKAGTGFRIADKARGLTLENALRKLAAFEKKVREAA